MAPALTSLSHGAGCGCKIPAADLRRIIGSLPRPTDPAVLVGHATADDAGVYRLRDDLALVQTVDFFTPIVDDPFRFGRIAAANALSDVYAMGATPITALNLVAFPLAQLGDEVLEAVLRGGADAVSEAGAALLGGHSIDDPEPKYGMAVTGVVHPEELLTNAGGRAGDELVLSKPLGAGAASTALKRGLEASAVMDAAVGVMSQLNAGAAQQARAAGAHALTDVTGFGLLGHLHELAEASGLAAEVEAEAIPAIPGVLELLDDDLALAGGSRRNRAWAEGFASFGSGVSEARRRLACDAMTSGGLLAALPPGRGGEVHGALVGRLVEGQAGTIRLV
jgi:selenide,water dikinase